MNDQRLPIAAGHRGWPTRFPDNTLAGFAAAAQVVPMVEIDVRLSLDGELVLSHDPDIAGRVVADTSWDDLSKINVGGGHRPARLEDLFDAQPDLSLDIEIKNSPFQPGFESGGETAIRVAEMARPIDFLSCFYWPTMDQVKERFPHVPTGLLIDEGGSLDDGIEHARSNGHEIIAPHWSLVHESAPDDLVVSVWTMNDPDLVGSLAEWGVSAIITDDPGLIHKALMRLTGGSDVD